MIAFITCNSNLVHLFEGLCRYMDLSSLALKFLPESNRRDLGIKSPALSPTEIVLHRLGLHRCIDIEIEIQI